MVLIRTWVTATTTYNVRLDNFISNHVATISCLTSIPKCVTGQCIVNVYMLNTPWNKHLDNKTNCLKRLSLTYLVFTSIYVHCIFVLPIAIMSRIFVWKLSWWLHLLDTMFQYYYVVYLFYFIPLTMLINPFHEIHL